MAGEEATAPTPEANSGGTSSAPAAVPSTSAGSEEADRAAAAAAAAAQASGAMSTDPNPPSSSRRDSGGSDSTSRFGAAAGTRGAAKAGVSRATAPPPKNKAKKNTCSAQEAEFWQNLQTGQEVAAAAQRSLVDENLTAEEAAAEAEAVAMARDEMNLLSLAVDEVAATRREEARGELTTAKGGLLAAEKALRERAKTGGAPINGTPTPAAGAATVAAASAAPNTVTEQGTRLIRLAHGGGGTAAASSLGTGGNASLGTGGKIALWAANTAGGAVVAAAGGGLGSGSSGGGSNTPTWGTGERSPYDPDRGEQGERYWASFPYPWNVVPQDTGLRPTEAYKIAAMALPKFRGDPGTYAAWRQSFIPCVHRTTMSVELKILLLRSSLEPGNSRMRELINNIVGNPDGYRHTIKELEKRYGGREAMLQARQEALLAVPELKEGDYRVVELLQTRLGTFLIEWAGYHGEGIDETESLAFYTLVMSKVERAYTFRYMDWLRQRGARRGLQSLHDWLGEQLDDHREVERFQRRRANSLRQAEGEKNGGGFRRSSVPTLRNRAFLAEEGEEETQEEEEAEAVLFGAGGRQNRRPRPPCSLCKADHPLAKCGSFQKMSPTERKAFLVKESRCFLCFQDNHPVTKCRFRYICARCGRKHHTMIHGAEDEPPTPTTLLTTEGEEDIEGAAEMLEFGLVARAPSKKGAVSLRTISLWVRNPENGRQIRVNALLDDGCSHAAMASQELAEALALSGPVCWATTEGVGGKVSTYRTFYALVEVQGPSGAPFAPLPAQVMQRPAGSYQPVDWTLHQSKFPHLEQVPITPPVQNGRIDLLIGSRFPTLSSALEEKTGGENDPIARKTPLGWTITGTTQPGTSRERAAALHTLLLHNSRAAPLTLGEFHPQAFVGVKRGAVCPLQEEPTDKQLVRLLQRMLEVDDPGEAEVLSPREEFIIEKVRKSLRQVQEGRYQAACTWKPGESRPILNYPQAERRLRSLENSKYMRDPNTAAAYRAAVRKWEEGGEVKEVPAASAEVRYLIPHFPIINPHNHSTPLRVVMDCKVGLNEHLLAGPNILNDVVGVLLRFRSGLVSFSGDVKKMFLRIFLEPQDRPFHCFLWRDKPEAELRVLQFQVHVFGNAGSPFVAVFVTKEHARRFQQEYPRAVETIHLSTLIDDVLDSVDTVQEAKNTLLQVRKVFAAAGMEMAKHHSSSQEVLKSLPPDAVARGDLAVSTVCQKEGLPSSLKALGIRYDAASDEFHFQMEANRGGNWTKRRVLKTFPRLYDPLGLLLPFTITARIFFSSIATPENGWDSPLSQTKDWLEWVEKLEELPLIRFPRCIKTEPQEEAVLHVFADASSLAYAAAAYVKVKDTVRLVQAKAHVAPRKLQSIPRMELLAAVLATKLAKKTAQHLKLRLKETHYWSDSLTVLYWLNDDAQRFQAFVHNKLQLIRRRTPLEDWHYVPTAENPADLATRGISPRRLAASTLWATGPRFLLHTWPSPPKLIRSSAVIAEMHKAEQVCLVQHSSEPLHLADRCSSYTRLRHMVKRLLSWRDKARRKLQLPPLSPPWERAEFAILYNEQFPLRVALSSKVSKEQWRKLGLTALPPKLAEDGLVRGQGRLRFAAALPLDLREPVLLPPKSHLADLLLKHAHEKQMKHYGGKNAALNCFLSRYWMPRARAAAFRQVRDCVPCRKRLQRPQRPVEAPLPPLRVPAPEGPVAFATTALDCAGPVKIKRGRAHEMQYWILFCCCHTRAVRLEHLSSLDVSSFLMAFTRAAAKGVLPHTVLSDNGTNFHAANNLLQELAKRLETGKIHERRPSIKWKFNPPYASHYGGVFERLIGAAKAALHHALPAHHLLTLEQFTTALAEVEGVLNARPLAYVSAGQDDFSALTPNHFLCGAASVPPVAADWPEDSHPLPKRWAELNSALRLFRQRFHKEVLPHLRLATQRRGSGRDLQVGDVVTFYLPSATNRWPLGRVVTVFPGSDGHVRTVEIAASPSPAYSTWDALDEPIASASEKGKRACARRQPIGARSVFPPDRTAPLRHFKRDVGSVALLLPAGEADIRHF